MNYHEGLEPMLFRPLSSTLLALCTPREVGV